MKKQTKTQLNRGIRKQLRRALMTPEEKKLRRMMLRHQTGIHIKHHGGVQ